MPRDPAQAITAAVSAARLMTYTREIARWVRLSGSEDERHAFDYLENTLKGFGLAVRRYEHDALISWPGTASLEVGNASAQRIECITHAFSVSTPPGGLEAEVVDVGAGPVGPDVRGKIALTDGLAMPERAHDVEQAGALGAIFINPPELHEMIISTVWGSPALEDLPKLPKLAAVSVRDHDGQTLRAKARTGELRVRLRTAAETRWRKTPILIADLRGREEPDRFVLFSGHVDSWHYGAMDNGSANAVMLEMARVLARRRRRLRRGVRWAFWSGHSHGRYSGSTWYADNHWEDLYRHAVLHLNVDSAGGQGATVLSEAQTMAETWPLAARAIKEITGQDLERRRISRMGDQSFWGIGLPSMFVDISAQPAGASATEDALAALTGGAAHHGGLGWWWHTPDDTLDKIDRDNLRRDAQVYALVLWWWCTMPVLPLDYRETAAELRATLRGIKDTAGDAFEMAPALDAAERFAGAAARLAAAADGIGHTLRRGTRRQRGATGAINDALMHAGRALIPINYTANGPFDHDPAVPVPPVPALHRAATLRTLPVGGDERLALLIRLTRERNKVVHAINTATEAFQHALAAAEGPGRGTRT